MAKTLEAQISVVSIAKISEGHDQDEWICANGGYFEPNELMIHCVIEEAEVSYISMGDRWISYEEFGSNPAKPVAEKLKKIGVDLGEEMIDTLHTLMAQQVDDDDYDLEDNWYFEITEGGETKLKNLPNAKYVFNIAFYEEAEYTLNDDGSVDKNRDPLDHLDFVGLAE